MIDFSIARRREGVSAHDAILDACTVRFRPIMMTTLAAILGTLPIAFGLGAGAESRQPLGIAVVGGLLTSTQLTPSCPAGYFHTDPHKHVTRAVVTHVHGDPAKSGCARTWTDTPGYRPRKHPHGAAAKGKPPENRTGLG